jgi:hypothetical protein
LVLAASSLAIAQAASQPAEGASGGARDVTAELTMIFEVGEHQLNVQETWALRNRSAAVVPAAQLTIPLPRHAKFARVMEKTRGFMVAEALTSIDAVEALPPGDRELTEGWLYDVSGSSADIARPIPFAVEHARLIIQEAPGLSIATNMRAEKRTRDLNGRSFAVYEVSGPIPIGTTLDISLTGLPAHTLWPRRATVAIVIAIVLWMVWALYTKAVPGKEGAERIVGPLSPRARRDQIVKAIEVLEQEYKEEKVKEKRFERRHAELLKELGAVLKEIELEKMA